MTDWKKRTEEFWREKLTPDQFRITRKKGTERAFTGEYYSSTELGTYLCVCCEQPLFDAAAKYDSGSGWPSFFQTIAPDAVATEEDRAHGMTRVELKCSRCDAHLGHVFEDGPKPTGLRYCINSASLKKK